MSSISPSSAHFSPSQGFPSPYKYEDPSEHQIPRSYPSLNTYYQSEQTPQKQHSKNESISSDAKVRLRKACDSCSVRKVKCDESGPPCKSCAALDIPCTFERPSRRRGPPNKHAEAIKRQRVHEDGSYALSESSPTHDAAYSLAALSAPSPMPLSAESICDLDTLKTLLEDYFAFIHPLIPIPHERTFWEAFNRRDDRHDRSFLALLASMLETLVASFPRRPRQLFTSEEARNMYPNAGVLIDKCHQVFNEARGIGYLDRDMNLYDACGSYLAGLAAGYMFDMQKLRRYFGECVMTLRSLNYHLPARSQREDNAESPDLDNLSAPQEKPASYIEQESGRRLFWLCFVGCMSIRQLGGTDGDILMPPMSHADQLPPMPKEVDDDYIFDNYIEAQPTSIVSVLKGFNLNVGVFRAFHALTALEMAFGTNELYDWDRQRRVIRQALSNVKAVTMNAPPELQLNPVSDANDVWPQTEYRASAYSHLLNGRQDPTTDAVGLPATSVHRKSTSLPYPRRAVQYEIQKANIYATQLATRSHLVEKFWNLYEIRETHGGVLKPPDRPASSTGTAGSPTVGALVSGVDHTYQNFWQTSRTPSDGIDVGEQAMAVEREDIVRDLAVLLRSINQVNMEPNGLSFCHKIRQVASTLLDMNRARTNVMPTLDSEAVNTYLLGFLDILSKLERLGTGRIRGYSGGSYDSNGNLIDEQAQTLEEVEEEELVHWASLKHHQERFVKANGFLVSM